MTPQFVLSEDDEPMATEPIYLSSDGSEYSNHHSTPDHYPENIYPDSHNTIIQLIAWHLEQRSNNGTATVFCPPTPDTSMISDEDEQHSITPINGDPAQYVSQIPQLRNQPLQLCQQLQPVPDTPESPPPESQGQGNSFGPYDLPKPEPTTPYNSLPDVSAVAAGLQNVTIHTHPEHIQRVTGCLLC